MPMKFQATGISAAIQVVDRFRRSLTNHSGLKARLDLAVTRRNSQVFIPEDSGRLADSLRQLGHPDQRSSLTSSNGGRSFTYNFGTAVPYAKYQQHRIRPIPPRRIRTAYERYLEGK